MGYNVPDNIIQKEASEKMEQNKNNGKGRKIIIILICVIVTAAAAIGILAAKLLNSISRPGTDTVASVLGIECGERPRGHPQRYAGALGYPGANPHTHERAIRPDMAGRRNLRKAEG